MQNSELISLIKLNEFESLLEHEHKLLFSITPGILLAIGAVLPSHVYY